MGVFADKVKLSTGREKHVFRLLEYTLAALLLLHCT